MMDAGRSISSEATSGLETTAKDEANRCSHMARGFFRLFDDGPAAHLPIPVRDVIADERQYATYTGFTSRGGNRANGSSCSRARVAHRHEAAHKDSSAARVDARVELRSGPPGIERRVWRLFARPLSDLSRGASVDDIVATATIVLAQS